MQVAAREIEQFSPDRTARVLSCAAKALHHSLALEELATSKHLLDSLPAMQPERVGVLLWALAILNLKPQFLLDRLQATMAATGESPWPGKINEDICKYHSRLFSTLERWSRSKICAC